MTGATLSMRVRDVSGVFFPTLFGFDIDYRFGDAREGLVCVFSSCSVA
jgi:hypothetical protein